MTMTRLHKIAAILTVLAGLTGCGDSTYDSGDKLNNVPGGKSAGTGTGNGTELKGTAIKGIVSGGKVICYDSNSKKLSETTTATDGTYTLKNCPTGGRIELTGGTDFSTGETVEKLIAPSDSKYITPITHLRHLVKTGVVNKTNLDTATKTLIEKSKDTNPLDTTNADAKKLVKLSVTLDRITKSIVNTGTTGKSVKYEDAFKTTIKAATESVSYGSKILDDIANDDTSKIDSAINKIVENVKKLNKVDLVADKANIKTIAKKKSAELQIKDKIKDAIKKLAPNLFPVFSRNDFIIEEKLDKKTKKFEVSFDVNGKLKDLFKNNSATLECRKFAKGTDQSIIKANWKNTTLAIVVPCPTYKSDIILASTDKDKVIAVKINYNKKDTYYTHIVGSLAITGALEFDGDVFVPTTNTGRVWDKKKISDLKTTATSNLKTGSLGYLPVGFYYDMDNLPTGMKQNVTFGVKFTVGTKTVKVYVDNLNFYKGYKRSSKTYPDNPFGTHNPVTADSGYGGSSYFKMDIGDGEWRDQRVDYKKRPIFPHISPIRFTKPVKSTETPNVNDVFPKRGTDIDLKDDKDVLGVNLQKTCDVKIPTITTTGKINYNSNTTLCQYIKVLMHKENAQQVTITPFIGGAGLASVDMATKKKRTSFTLGTSSVKLYDLEPVVFKGIISQKKSSITEAGTTKSLVDTDGDGVSDDWELKLGRDPFTAQDKTTDTDSDGVTDIDEIAMGTDADNSNDKIGFKIDKTGTQYIAAGIANKFDVKLWLENSKGSSDKYNLSSADVTVSLSGGADKLVKLPTVKTQSILGTSYGVRKTFTITPKDTFGVFTDPKVVFTAVIKKQSGSTVTIVKSISLKLKNKPTALVIHNNATSKAVGNTVYPSNILKAVDTAPAGVRVNSKSYQWYTYDAMATPKNIAITGATNQTYTVPTTMSTKYIFVRVGYATAGSAVKMNDPNGTFKDSSSVSVGLENPDISKLTFTKGSISGQERVLTVGYSAAVTVGRKIQAKIIKHSGTPAVKSEIWNDWKDLVDGNSKTSHTYTVDDEDAGTYSVIIRQIKSVSRPMPSTELFPSEELEIDTSERHTITATLTPTPQLISNLKFGTSYSVPTSSITEFIALDGSSYKELYFFADIGLSAKLKSADKEATFGLILADKNDTSKTWTLKLNPYMYQYSTSYLGYNRNSSTTASKIRFKGKMTSTEFNTLVGKTLKIIGLTSSGTQKADGTPIKLKLPTSNLPEFTVSFSASSSNYAKIYTADGTTTEYKYAGSRSDKDIPFFDTGTDTKTTVKAMPQGTIPTGGTVLYKWYKANEESEKCPRDSDTSKWAEISGQVAQTYTVKVADANTCIMPKMAIKITNGADTATSEYNAGSRARVRLAPTVKPVVTGIFGKGKTISTSIAAKTGYSVEYKWQKVKLYSASSTPSSRTVWADIAGEKATLMTVADNLSTSPIRTYVRILTQYKHTATGVVSAWMKSDAHKILPLPVDQAFSKVVFSTSSTVVNKAHTSITQVANGQTTLYAYGFMTANDGKTSSFVDYIPSGDKKLVVTINGTDYDMVLADKLAGEYSSTYGKYTYSSCTTTSNCGYIARFKLTLTPAMRTHTVTLKSAAITLTDKNDNGYIMKQPTSLPALVTIKSFTPANAGLTQSFFGTGSSSSPSNITSNTNSEKANRSEYIYAFLKGTGLGFAAGDKITITDGITDIDLAPSWYNHSSYASWSKFAGSTACTGTSPSSSNNCDVYRFKSSIPTNNATLKGGTWWIKSKTIGGTTTPTPISRTETITIH